MSKQKAIKLSFLFISIIILSSCNTRKAQEKLADERLKHIEQLIDANSLNAAKIEIDSIHLLYPRLVNKRKIAESLNDTIIRRESARTLAYCDSILPLKIREMDSIAKNFRHERDSVYQEVGNFVYKTQRTENNATRTYLKTFVDDNADFYLVSNYCGSKIDYVCVEVTANDLLARTDSVGLSDAKNYSFTDAGTLWQSITFKNEAEKGVTAFIAQNSADRIKVTLQGKKSYVYYLSDVDKTAIKETYHLWIVKSDVVKLKKEIKKASLKIERINKLKKIN